MTIVLTGSTGLIGKKILTKLKEKNNIITIGRHDCDYILDIANEDNMKELESKIKECDVIVHCAAKISFDNEDATLIETNIQGVLNICKFAKNMKVKQVIYLSSVPIVGNHYQTTIFGNEKDYPKSLYHISKLAGEMICDLYGKFFSTCILRIAAPIDPVMSENRMFSIFMKKAISGETIKINGKGTRIQTYTSTHDIANIVELCINSGLKGKYLMPGEIFSNIDLAKVCKSICCSDCKIVVDEHELPEDNEKWIVSDELHRIFNYHTECGVYDVLRQMKERFI